MRQAETKCWRSEENERIAMSTQTVMGAHVKTIQLAFALLSVEREGEKAVNSNENEA